MWIAIGAGVIVVFGGAAAFLLIRKRRKPRERGLVSIVLLRRSRRGLTEAEVRSIARRTLHSAAEVVAMPPMDEHRTTAFGIAVQDRRFFVIDAGRPYVNDLEDAAGRFEDPRAREAMRTHSHWVSADAAGGQQGREPDEMTVRAVGRIAAELLDGECTLIYAPWLGRFAFPGPETESALKGADPLSIFREFEPNAPIIGVESGDRKIEAAMAQAKREWPRFVEVWKGRGAACSGIVKGRFPYGGDGAAEYMWIEVEDVQDGVVVGTLANEPAHVPLKQGARVRIRAGDVVDWACEDGNGQPLGMFVERVLMEKMAKGR